MKLSRTAIFFLGIFCVTSTVYAQGIFDKTADWGPRTTYKVAGNAAFSGGTYTLQGNGDDIWTNDDEGFFLYKEVSGNQTLTGKVHWLNSGGNEWAKAGVMMRETGSAAGSRHYWAALRGGTTGTGDRIDAQWRSVTDGASGNVEIQANATSIPDPGEGIWLRVSRISSAGLVAVQYSLDGTTWVLGDCREQAFTDKIAWGLAVTNHDDNEVLAEATFSDVKLESTVPSVGYRTFSIDDPVFTAGQAITVTIKVGELESAAKVTETPPAGWTISSVSNSGAANAGTITWDLAASTSAKTLTYVVTPPASAASNVVFTGSVGGNAIFGDNALDAPAPVGIFDHHLDVGDVSAAGNAEYDAAKKQYIVTGSGADIWDVADEFQFVYKKASGAFEIQATIFAFNDTSTNEWSKAGLMVRDNLTAGSPHMLGLVRGSDAQLDTGWRVSQGGSSSDIGLSTLESGQIKLVRSGKTVESYYLNSSGAWTLHTSQNLDLSDPVYVGLALTSHDDGNITQGEYDNVVLTLRPFYPAKSASLEKVTVGSSVDVQLLVDVREGEKPTFSIVEKYGSGLTVSGLSASAGQATDDKKGTINWNATGATGQITLKYTLNVPADFKDSFVTSTGTFDDGQGYTGKTGDLALPIQAASMGIFQGHSDIGTVGAAGNISVDGDTWKVFGSGADIWGTADSFHYLWLKAQGDFKFSLENPYIGAYGNTPSTNDWQKMGVMVRQDLTAPSAYVIGLLRASDQRFYFQWRDANATDAAGDDANASLGADVWNPNYDPAVASINQPSLDQVTLGGGFVVERVGDTFTASYLFDGQEEYIWEHDTVMTDPVYVGVAVTSHQAGAMSQGVFSNPKFTGKTVAVQSWMLF